MTHWKQRLQAMHPVCRCKRSLLIIVLSFAVVLCACSKKEIEEITLREWIRVLNETAGISVYENTSPYFINITQEDTCYEDVQAAVEWKVLDPSYGFDPDEVLTKEWVAYTLMNLCGKEQSESLNIKDISDSIFKNQIQAAVSSGLMQVDQRNLFHPEDVIDKNQALELLQQAVSFINNREITETKTDIVFKNDQTVKEVVPLQFNSDTLTAQFQNTEALAAGDIVHWKENTTDHYYSISNMDSGSVYLEEIDILEKTESMEMSGSTSLDFSNAEIVDGNGNLIQETSYTNKLEWMSTNPYQKSFKINDFGVKITASSSSVKAEISKTLLHGSKLYGAIKVNSVRCDYDWNSKGASLEDAYFKVNFHSEEDLGLKNSSYKNLYGDFSKFDANAFVQSLTGMFVEKNDVVEDTITLCEIRVPIPSAPLLNISMSLDLNLFVSGKAEIVLSQANTFGCEIRDGKTRFIHETDHTNTNRIKATTGISAGATFGLNLASVRLADVSMNAGLQASLKTTLHLYHEDSHSVVESDVSADVADTLAQDNPNILVCSDMNAYLVLYVKLNSSKSALGKFGLSKRIDILSSSNSSLLPDGKKHLENFQFVDKCTRKDREKSKKVESLRVTKKITLQEYSLIVHIQKNHQLIITGLPDGYKKSDLIYTSDNSSVAMVDENGYISGVGSGSAVIKVSTSDGSHYIKCNVLVPME